MSMRFEDEVRAKQTDSIRKLVRIPKVLRKRHKKTQVLSHLDFSACTRLMRLVHSLSPPRRHTAKSYINQASRLESSIDETSRYSALQALHRAGTFFFIQFRYRGRRSMLSSDEFQAHTGTSYSLIRFNQMLPAQHAFKQSLFTQARILILPFNTASSC